jgi:hypothetical protein
LNRLAGDQPANGGYVLTDVKMKVTSLHVMQSSGDPIRSGSYVTCPRAAAPFLACFFLKPFFHRHHGARSFVGQSSLAQGHTRR